MQCLFLKVVGEAFFLFYSQWRLQGHRPMEGIVPTILWGAHLGPFLGPDSGNGQGLPYREFSQGFC